MLLFLNPTIKTQWKVWLFIQTFHCVFQHIHRRSSSFSALWIYTILKLFCSRDQCGLVSLPYGFTLFSNYSGVNGHRSVVLLPYGFTLFSNTCSNRCGQCRFYYLMDLHYSQTLSSKMILRSLFYYLIDLHYSQTRYNKEWQGRPFYYLIDLHYSQTR